jgi:hypothetical protein
MGNGATAKQRLHHLTGSATTPRLPRAEQRLGAGGAATPEQQVAVLSRAQQYARSLGQQHERISVIDVHGRDIVGEQQSTSKATSTTSWERFTLSNAAAKAVRAATAPELIHTHPDHLLGGSLSNADVKLAMELRTAAMHAVGTGIDGRAWLFTLRPGPAAIANGTWNRKTYEGQHMGRTIGAITRAANKEYAGKLRRGEMSFWQADNGFRHDVMQRIAAHFGPDFMRYEGKPLPDDMQSPARVAAARRRLAAYNQSPNE